MVGSEYRWYNGVLTFYQLANIYISFVMPTFRWNIAPSNFHPTYQPIYAYMGFREKHSKLVWWETWSESFQNAYPTFHAYQYDYLIIASTHLTSSSRCLFFVLFSAISQRNGLVFIDLNSMGTTTVDRKVSWWCYPSFVIQLVVPFHVLLLIQSLILRVIDASKDWTLMEGGLYNELNLAKGRINRRC